MITRITRYGSRARGFTLTEILIVIAIVVLLIAMAVPAFNLISGSRSVAGARNQVSAMLGRARAQAIGLQKPTGVMFFRDARTQRVSMALVVEADTDLPKPPQFVWLTLDDADFVPLPTGVGLQTMCDAAIGAGGRTSDGYVGFNTGGETATGGTSTVNTSLGGSAYGGVILFDGAGRLSSMRYGFVCADTSGPTAMGALLKSSGSELMPIFSNPLTPNLFSQFGFVMYERDLFANAPGASEDDARLNGGSYTTDERAEEDWLDQNATPVLINRYTGTLVSSGQ